VYTTKARYGRVGLQLIQIVKQNLHYKTDAYTGQVHTQQFEGKNFRRDLYWNKARPRKAIYYDCRKSRSSAGKAAEEKTKPNSQSALTAHHYLDRHVTFRASASAEIRNGQNQCRSGP
jgi:hypothetical protein